MSEKNPKLDFQLITYTKPSRFKIIIAYAATQNMGKSRVLDHIIEFFIEENFNDQQRQNLIRMFDSMSEKQKKNPAKYWEEKQ